MANAKAKTVVTTKSVTSFIKSVPDEAKQKDCFRIIEIMQQQSGFEPKMWGPAIVGFGSYHYKYESGREGDAPLCGFSPRKAAISLYLFLGAEDRKELLGKFGKHTTAKYCIYIKKLDDISIPVLKKMIKISVKRMKNMYN
jgi:hypothetical protein